MPTCSNTWPSKINSTSSDPGLVRASSYLGTPRWVTNLPFASLTIIQLRSYARPAAARQLCDTSPPLAAHRVVSDLACALEPCSLHIYAFACFHRIYMQTADTRMRHDCSGQACACKFWPNIRLFGEASAMASAISQPALYCCSSVYDFLSGACMMSWRTQHKHQQLA